MDSINLSTIKHDVRVILDQNAEGYDVPNVGEYTLDLDEIITQCVEPAVEWVHMNAPLSKLRGKTPASTTISNSLVALPDDFMRLISFRMNGWNRSATSFILEDDPQISQIVSGYPGLAPTAANPLLMMVMPTATTSASFKPYPLAQGDTVAVMRYLPKPKINNSAIDIEPLVYQAFLYYLAHLVKATYNEQNTFAEQAQALL